MAQCVVCSSEIRDDARFCPSCGAEQPRAEVAGTDADPLMGKVVAKKFKVEKLLGVGGMGKVYKARQLSLDKAVVVKVLHDHFREDPQLVQRFQREAKAASRLNHPNSIQIIDFGQDEGGVVFMAMEFLQGQDLFSVLKKDGPLAADRIARIMVQACSALQEAHEQHVVHRDLKPENIMVEDRRTQKDFVKVLDFGIAKIQDPGEGQQALTQAGMVCGTPEYMSPEQARGLNLDARSDIYALGVVMYQLAVGELPFVSDTPIGIVTKHILEKPVPPRQRAPQLNIPQQLEDIILKCMEKEADKRFPTVADISEALQAMLAEIAPGREQSGSHPVSRQTGPQPKPDLGPPKDTGPTLTKPTPTNQVTATNDAPVTVPPSSGSAGTKIAIAAFAGVLVVGLGLGAVWKLAGNKDDPKKDPEHPVVVENGIKADPIKTPDPNATKAPDPDATKTPDPNATKPPPDPNATKPPDPNATKPPDPNATALTKPPDPNATKPPADHTVKIAATGGKAEMEKAFREGMAAFNNDDCHTAVPLFIKAAKLDPSFADPLQKMASCAKRAGNTEGACSAIKEYIKRKHPSPAISDGLLKANCN